MYSKCKSQEKQQQKGMEEEEEIRRKTEDTKNKQDYNVNMGPSI